MFDFTQKKINLLSDTSRKFYQKKKKNQNNFNSNYKNLKQNCSQSLDGLVNPKPKLTKIIRILNNNVNAIKKQKSQRLYQRFLTQGNFQDNKELKDNFKMHQLNSFIHSNLNERKSCQKEKKQFNEQQFIQKQLKARIQILYKRFTKQKQKIWRQLLDSYQDIKFSESKQVFVKKQNQFYSKLVNALKLEEQLDEFSLNKNKSFGFLKQNQVYSCKNEQKMKNQRRQNQNIAKQQNKETHTFKILDKATKQTRLQFENVKLKKQNQILKTELQKYFKNSSFSYNLSNKKPLLNSFQQNIKTEFLFNSVQNETTSINNCKAQLMHLNNRIEQLQTQNIKLKDQLFGSTQTIKTLKSQKIQSQNRIIQLKLQNELISAEIVQIKTENQISGSKIQKWRATLAFQSQELNSYQNQLLNVKNQYKELNRKYKALMKRINKINSNASGQKLPDLPTSYYQLFNEQIQSFIKVRSPLVNKNSSATFDKSTNQKANIILYKSFSTQKQTVNNLTGIKRLPRQHYGYFKPNFYTYVQNYLDLHGIDQKNYQIVGPDLNLQFLTTIRAILDSKFNQFMEIKQFNNISSFSNFTYSWLNTYKIHQKSKKIILLKEGQESNTAGHFYINLMKQRLNSNWQVIAFRQFMMNTLTKDELYFYLLVRHAALKGDMVQNISGMYQQIVYINVAQTLLLIQKFVNDLAYRRRLQQYVKKSIIYIRKKALIDMHFICRIILEYYIFKKHQDYINLNSLVQLLSRQKSGYLSFQIFMKIFDYNFTYLTLVDKLNIYQKCFSSSRQKITLQVFLTILSEEGYLCYEIKQIDKLINCHQESIKIVKNQSTNKLQENQVFSIQPNIKQIVQFQQFFRQKITQFQKEIVNLGLQSQKNKLQANKELNLLTIFSRLHFINNLCILTAQKIFYSKKISIQQVKKLLPLFIDHFNKIIPHTIQKKQYMEYAYEFKRNTAAKKIIRFYKKKKNQMHRNFIFNISDKLNEQDEKVQNLRQEFSNMISNLKNKYQNNSKKKLRSQQTQFKDKVQKYQLE